MNYNTQSKYSDREYVAIHRTDGTVMYVEKQPAIWAWDGTMLFSAERVSRATPEELREMRETLRAYNNRD
jgi:hypothetical protein